MLNELDWLGLVMDLGKVDRCVVLFDGDAVGDGEEGEGGESDSHHCLWK